MHVSDIGENVHVAVLVQPEYWYGLDSEQAVIKMEELIGTVSWLHKVSYLMKHQLDE